MTAIGALRIQTLTRRLNRCQVEMSLLSQQHKMIAETSIAVGREYRQLYNQINGLGETIDAEFQDILTSKFGQLQDVYFVMTNKESDIEEQIKVLNTQYQAISEELKNVKKFNEESAKKEVVKF